MKQSKETLTIVWFVVIIIFTQNSTADRKLPLEGGKIYLVTVGYNGVSIFYNNDGSPWVDQYHQGVAHQYALDFDNPPGDDNITIVATDVGEVEYIYNDPTTGYGWGVKLRHPNGHRTIYAHFTAQPFVSLNQTVVQGQPLGKMGATGWAQGTHLHFEEIDENGNSVRPEPMSGYTSFTPGFSYTSDNYPNSSSLVALYSNGSTNQRILSCYNQNGGQDMFGSPWSNGSGGVYVHSWPDNSSDPDAVWLQDFLTASGHWWQIVDNPAAGAAFSGARPNTYFLA